MSPPEKEQNNVPTRDMHTAMSVNEKGSTSVVGTDKNIQGQPKKARGPKTGQSKQSVSPTPPQDITMNSTQTNFENVQVNTTSCPSPTPNHQQSFEVLKA